jgi:hypothetical protein
MRIFSEMLEDKNLMGEPRVALVLYHDSQKTGDVNQDYTHVATDFTHLIDSTDPEKILAFLMPMLNELIYTVYGKSGRPTEPLTDWHATGFDRNYPNGVKA